MNVLLRARASTLRFAKAKKTGNPDEALVHALKLQFLEVEIRVRHVKLHFVNFSLRVQGEGDEASWEWIDNRLAP